MMRPSSALVRRYGIPSAVLAEAFGPSSAHSAAMRDVVAPIEAILAEA